MTAQRTTTDLSDAMTSCANARLALFGFRRMGAHGLDDARAAHAFLTGFGRSFRRPLVLMRALVADISSGAAHPIRIAPCCCSRQTAAESALLAVLARAETQPDAAHLLLADMLGVRRADGVLAGATALAAAFADEGRPIAG
jgi:hypothetical protein